LTSIRRGSSGCWREKANSCFVSSLRASPPTDAVREFAAPVVAGAELGQDVGVTDDHGEQIVEIVRHAAGQPPTASIFCDWRSWASASRWAVTSRPAERTVKAIVLHERDGMQLRDPRAAVQSSQPGFHHGNGALLSGHRLRAFEGAGAIVGMEEGKRSSADESVGGRCAEQLQGGRIDELNDAILVIQMALLDQVGRPCGSDARWRSAVPYADARVPRASR